MKKVIINILCTTGITLVVLAIIATMFGGKYLFVNSVFQCLIANVIIHIGLLFINKIESSYAILEYTLDIVYTIAVVLAFGAVFDWYSSTPIWILIIMSVMIYFIGILLSIFQMRYDIEEINKLLEKRNYSFTSKEIKK